MVTVRVRLAAAGRAAAGATLLLALACAGPPAATGPLPERRTAFARPDQDPALRSLPLDERSLTGVERVVVRLSPGPRGGVRLVEVVSPDLTPAERADLARAIEAGEVRPETGPERQGASWTSTVLRRR
ncbi:conserved hypothetical protein [Anaeromyxobacter dehalogenans 2CP-1]|uniref:Lipoprotein n=1 Tax=Anaeromyxobacter dehalogenans (strain ATCC BAA-258 / DSM 21875 / 2CP-1) TaxID=455488 RepID=B8J6G8_ANAD2|nr:hypothetical protein [Anaeromyxobacter dehalogenans]ACL65149.1 conserved hypothetical protein [Anaeromyxobacter dehalogenans 2CP-1]